MFSALFQLFSSDGYMPHGMCLLWEPGLMRLHIVSDALIALSYYSMPIALGYFASKRSDFTLSWILILFGIFILACGTTHILGIWTLWYPNYVVDGIIKAITAAASIPTAVILWLIMPKALAMPNMRQLADMNFRLREQIEDRERSETALNDMNEKLIQTSAKLQQSEQEAQALSNRLALGAQAGGIGIWDYDVTAHTLWWDDRLCELYRVPLASDGNAYKTWISSLYPDDRERVESEFGQAAVDGETYESDYRIVWPDGDVRAIRTTGKIYRDPSGQIVRLVGISFDVTDLRQKEDEAARRALDRFQRVVEAAPNAMVLSNASGAIEMVNTEAERLFGYDRSELLGQQIEILLPARLRGHHPALRQSYAAMPVSRPMGAGRELFGMRKNGSEFPVEIGLNPIETQDGSMILSAIVDISERRRATEELKKRTEELNVEVEQRRQAEAALRKSSAEFRYLFRNNPLPMWVYDAASLKFLEINDSAVLGYGFSRDEFLKMSIFDIRPPEEVARLQKNLAVETASYQQSSNWMHRRKDGGIIRADIFSHAITFEGKSARLIVALDVTKRNETEEQLRQAQKMEAIGQLTGGVAHDFNNLLAIIQGNLELIKERIETDPRLSEMAGDALRATERGAVLTQHLLAYSRQQPLEPHVLALESVVADLTSMLSRTLEETIQVEASIAPDIWKVRIDPHQLENSLLNLAVNARDAMPAGGKLTIEASNSILDELYAAENADVTPGNYVMIAVTDTGVGMSSETIGRAFEPFFTTKTVGRGTGLGLSMVYGFVKQSGGHIKIYSEIGHGTTVKLYLPSAQEETAAAHALRREAVVPKGNQGEVILVVEDDAAVRKLAIRLLTELGYETISAEDGGAALKILETDARIDLLFTDVVMPGGMNGPALARKAQIHRPDLRVLYMSGYTKNAILHNGELDEGVHLLAKPFRKIDLATKVRDALS